MRLVVLANSKRPDGQCIAGIDFDTGQWIRPVPTGGDGIPTSRCFAGGRFISVRDVVELDVGRPRTTIQFQAENRLIRNWNWRIVGRARAETVEKYIEDTVPILHSRSDRVDPRAMIAMPPQKWKSLQLVRPVNLSFGRHHLDPNRWVANFQDRRRNRYSLKITDPEATRTLEAGKQISGDSLLTVSLTKPWAFDASKTKPLCYKLVAAVIGS